MFVEMQLFELNTGSEGLESGVSDVRDKTTN